MKKIYQKPAINIVKVKVGNLMEASQIDKTLNDTGGSGTKALGRAWYEWDD